MWGISLQLKLLVEISFIIYLNLSKPVSEVFYTLNTLSVSRCKSVQIGHRFRKFHNRKRRNTAIKSCIKNPLLMKDQLLTWLHQKNEQTPTTSKHTFKFNYNHFHVSLFAKPAPLLLLSFFLTRPLIDRCQIVTDTCETNVSKFFL